MLKQWLPMPRRRSEDARRPMSIAEMLEDFWQRPAGFPSMLAEFQNSPFRGWESFPAVNVSETDKEIRVEAELPGLESGDVDISLERDVLVIRGEKKFQGEEKKESYHRIERSYGSFTRAVPLPAPVEAEGVKARFEKGVLRVTLPKAEPGKPARKITIEG